MLHQAQIIVPLKDNAGADMSATVEKVIRDLCRANGGCTVYQAKGYWLNDEGRLFEDDVAVIVSAMTKGRAANAKLRDLARAVIAESDQEAVFVGFPDGRVEIIPRD